MGKRTGTRSMVIGAVLAVLAVGALSACKPVPDTYVAIGDSYTAGPLILNQSLSPLGCLRSDRNYPRRVRPNIDVAEFRDVSCSGADTRDLFSSQGVTPGPANQPQLDALDINTKVVTIQIGGNDIGFSSIVQDCVELNPWGNGCRGQFLSGGQDELRNRIAATAPKIDDVLAAAKERATRAEIFLVGYPTLLPTTGNGCWPVVPIIGPDVQYLRGVAADLNAMLADRAAANGVHYVDLATPSIGHDMCSSDKWVEAIVPTTDAAPVHPNAKGMRNFGDTVTAEVNAVLAAS